MAACSLRPLLALRQVISSRPAALVADAEAMHEAILDHPEAVAGETALLGGDRVSELGHLFIGIGGNHIEGIGFGLRHGGK